MDTVINEAVLQVGVNRQALTLSVDDAPVRLGINVGICLAAVVAIILVVDGQKSAIMQVVDVRQCTGMQVGVVAGCSTYLHIRRFGHILGTEDRPVKMAVKVLAVQSIGFFDFFPVLISIIVETKIGKFLVLVLLVVTLAMGVEKSGIEAPMVRKRVSHMQLQVLLGVIVGLVVVIDRRVAAVRSHDGIFTCRVIAAVRPIHSISGVVVHAVPRHTGFLVAAKERQHHFRFVGIVTEVGEIGIEVRGGAIKEAVGVDLAEPRVHSKTSLAQTGRNKVRRSHLSESIIHTAIETDSEMIRGVKTVIVGTHVDGTSKRRAIGGSAHAALNVHRGERSGQVGHIHPEHGLRLLVIHRHVIHGHGNTRMVCTTQTEITVTHTQTVVRGHLQSRSEHQQVGQILSGVVLVELLIFQLDMVGRSLLNTLCDHLNVSHLVHEQRKRIRFLRMQEKRCSTCCEKKKRFFHYTR